MVNKQDARGRRQRPRLGQQSTEGDQTADGNDPSHHRQARADDIDDLAAYAVVDCGDTSVEADYYAELSLHASYGGMSTSSNSSVGEDDSYEALSRRPAHGSALTHPRATTDYDQLTTSNKKETTIVKQRLEAGQ